MAVGGVRMAGARKPAGFWRLGTLLAVWMLALSAMAAAAQTVTIAVASDISTGDPHKVFGGDEQMFFSNSFEGLYGHDLDGKLMAMLATSHKVSADGLSYEFQLRKDVVFHNGDPFGAEDVRFSWLRAIDPRIRNPRASVVVNNIRDVEIVDPLTVKLHLRSPDASLLENLGEYFYIVPKGLIEQVGDQAFAEEPVGTGPYAFAGREAGEHIRLIANKAHWGHPPAVDEILLRIVPDDLTRVGMLRAGLADMVVGVPADMGKQIEADPASQLLIVPSYQNIFVSMTNHRADGTLADKKVRQAFNFAIDKKAIIDRLLSGHARQVAAPCQKGVIGCDIGREPYPYDEKKARQLLQEAKFNFDKTYRFVAMMSGRVPRSGETAEAIVQYLERVGVKASLDILPYGEWLEFVLARRFDEAEMIFWTWSDYNNDPMGRLARSVRTEGSNSWVSYPTLDPLLDEANGIVDAKAREEHLRKIFQLIYDDPPFIFLWTLDKLYAVGKHVDWQPAANVAWPIFWKIAIK
jgi:peptide/nickel transport system substrate-binding protein